jgi:hypothetical protein
MIDRQFRHPNYRPTIRRRNGVRCGEHGRVERIERRWASLAVELSGSLLLATLVTDAFGLTDVSFYLLVAGVPLTALAGLACYERVVDGDDPRARFQAMLLGLLVVAVVLGAAARQPSISQGDVPVAATGALVLGLVLLAAQAVIALRAHRER